MLKMRLRAGEVVHRLESTRASDIAPPRALVGVPPSSPSTRRCFGARL